MFASLAKKNFVLPIILIFAFFLRIYNLSSIPVSLNPDELAIGYNAYSIMVSGADEWGNRFPLTLKSFGDWKLLVYPLLTIPFIAIFDLNEFSVRILSVLAGVLSVFLVYKISYSLFENKHISLISSLFVSISPWSVLFSRGAYEPNLAVTLYLLGFLFLLKYIEKGKNLKLIIFSAISFGLTLFTYHAFLVFTPLFVILITFYFKKSLTKKALLTAGSIFLLFILFSFFSLAQGSGSKLSAVGVFNNENVLYLRAEKYRADNTQNPIISRVLYNRFTVTPYHIAQNYLLTFSPKFLFDGETTKLFYGIGGFGYLYLLDALFIFFGIVGMLKNKKKNFYLLIGWIFISPVSSAITLEAPSVTRLIQIVPPLMILSAYGAHYLYTIVKSYSFYKLIRIGLLLLFFTNFIYFVDQYFNHMNYQRGRFFNFGYKEMVVLGNKYPDKKIVVRGPENFPYVAFLFYNKYDSYKFRKEVGYYPPEPNGFVFVKSFGRYEFVRKIDRRNLNPETIYIDNYKPGDKNIISFPSSDPAFSYFIK